MLNWRRLTIRYEHFQSFAKLHASTFCDQLLLAASPLSGHATPHRIAISRILVHGAIFGLPLVAFTNETTLAAIERHHHPEC